MKPLKGGLNVRSRVWPQTCGEGKLVNLLKIQNPTISHQLNLFFYRAKIQLIFTKGGGGGNPLELVNQA